MFLDHDVRRNNLHLFSEAFKTVHRFFLSNTDPLKTVQLRSISNIDKNSLIFLLQETSQEENKLSLYLKKVVWLNLLLELPKILHTDDFLFFAHGTAVGRSKEFLSAGQSI